MTEISNAFKYLVGQLEFTPAEVDAINTHVRTVSSRLAASFGPSKQKVIGSAARGSTVRQSSDADLMVVLRLESVRVGDRVRRSDSVLAAIRDDLRQRFRATEIGRDGQAIVVDFGDGHSVDVVPALYADWVRTGGVSRPLLRIPDGAGDWMDTSPEAHNQLIEQAGARSGGKLRNVARLLKFWRATRATSIPLNSFHVELLLADTGICDGVKTYGYCLALAVQELSQRECRGLQDPLGISGVVKACNTEPKREQTVRALAETLRHAAQALEAERQGDMDEAFRRWSLVFNGQFPSRATVRRAA